MENYEDKIQKLIEEGYDFSIGQYVKNGFELFKVCANAMIPYSVIYCVAIIILSRIPGIDIVMGIMISPCIVAGFYLAANLAVQGIQPSFNDCWDGFKMFANVVVINLLVSALTAVGYICLIIPGVYLMVAYTFASMFVIFLKIDFREALRLSRKLVHCNWWKMFGLVILTSIIGFSGTILCGFGIAFTLPIMYCILYTAFEDIVGKALRK